MIKEKSIKLPKFFDSNVINLLKESGVPKFKQLAIDYSTTAQVMRIIDTVWKESDKIAMYKTSNIHELHREMEEALKELGEVK